MRSLYKNQTINQLSHDMFDNIDELDTDVHTH